MGSSFVLYTCTLLLFFLIPPSTDEAYYIKWSQHLQIGYLDHPPLVAWLLSLASKLSLPSHYAARFLSLLSFFGSIYFLKKIYSLLLPSPFLSSADKTNILSISLFSFGGMAFYFFWTPDTTLVFLYAATMYFALKIGKNNSNPHALVGFSFFAALSIYAKYTSFFFITGIFLGFCLTKQKIFNTLIKSSMIILICLLPLLYETKLHQGGSFYFLFHRGFFKTYVDPYTDLNQKQYEEFFKHKDPKEEIIHKNFAESFKNLGSKNDATYEVLQSSQKFMQSHFKTYLFEYLSSIFLFFGLYSFYFIYLRIKNKIKFFSSTENPMKVLKITVFFYLFFFGLLSIFSKVEANWIAPVLIFIPIIYAESLKQINQTVVQKIALTHTLIFFILAATISICIHFLPEQSYWLASRIRKEYFGFKDLSSYVQNFQEASSSKSTILTQNYQIASQLHFYAPSILASQIPGLARPSQWTREFMLENPSPNTYFENASDLVVISQDRHPPTMSTHNLFEMRALISCGNQKNLEVLIVKKTEIESNPITLNNNCTKGQNQIWFLSFYSPKT